MAFTSSDKRLCSSVNSEMPLWFVSRPRRSEEKIASRRSILPSELPPFAVLSNSARARNPFGCCDDGCGLWFPNNSWRYR